VHIAYRIDASGVLCCSAAQASFSGGLMGLTSHCDGPIFQQERLLRAIVQECERRRFSGVFFDTESSSVPDCAAFLDALGTELRKHGKQLYSSLSSAAANTTFLIRTALAEGSLSDMLRERRNRYGSRIALDLERMRMDFILPCPSGRGKPLSAEELAALRRKYGMSVFFSRDLCAHYFTYSLGKEAHFVVFDDAETLKCKMDLGRTLGIDTGFFMYPEVKDILPQLSGIIR